MGFMPSDEVCEIVDITGYSIVLLLVVVAIVVYFSLKK